MSKMLWMSGCAAVVGLALSASAQGGGDPYLWLEEVTGEKPLAWVQERNAETTATLTGLPGFAATQDRILRILDSKDRIPYLSKAGRYYYNFWKDQQNPRGIWRRTSLDEYRKSAPAWETVIDLDEIARSEKEDWVWKRAEILQPSHRRCLVQLSRGGSDAIVVREFDLNSKQFVKEGFKLLEAKTRVAWKDIDTLLVGTDFGPGSLTTSGYPRVVKEWKRGTSLPSAKVVFEGQPGDVGVSGFRTTEKGYERVFVSRDTTFFSQELLQQKDGKLTRIEVPSDARAIYVNRDLLFVELRTPWTIGSRTYAAGSLLVTPFDAFQKGARDFDVLFAPAETRSLSSFTVLPGGVILNELDKVKNRLYVLTRKGSSWQRAELPGAPTAGRVTVTAVDADASDDFFLTVTDYLTPPTYLLGSLRNGRPDSLKASPAYFNSAGMTITQHEATSKDGTKIPYFQVSHENLKLDSANPTLMTGYGGFQLSSLPAYNGGVGSAWLEKGGVYVVANIRGGGEYGPRWHQAALKEKRHRAYEDFAAVADDLVRRKVTSPRHLGAQGGSNGGLLMGNMLTLYPEKFGAIVCQVPLLDMQRYHKLLAGASWMAEYGNPDLPQEWDFIRTFSPYHNVRQEARYPRVLFTTSTRDDRVHPGHARKMCQKMRALGHDVLYYENIEGGHGGAADNKQSAFMSTLAYSFLWEELKQGSSARRTPRQKQPRAGR